MTPGELTDLVESYAAFGNHHTGSAADQTTTDWLHGLLDDRGAAVGRLGYGFTRWQGTASLELTSGEPVPVEPVFYSAIGRFERDDCTIIDVDRRVAGNARGLDIALAAAEGTGAIVVVVDGPADMPVQCNRVPSETGHGRPAVIVPGNWGERVRAGAELVFEGATTRSTSEVITAELGDPDASPVVVTTPLTGWFRCAGERGTGIAAALALVDDLAQDHLVRFVGCSGHEIDHLGLQAWLAGDDPIPGGRVIHLGASVGAVETTPDGPRLASTRLVLSTVADPVGRSAVAAAAEIGAFTLFDMEPWAGEGANWRAAGAEVLSFLGTTSLFHTAADLPDAATTPEALATAIKAVIATTREFLRRG